MSCALYNSSGYAGIVFYFLNGDLVLRETIGRFTFWPAKGDSVYFADGRGGAVAAVVHRFMPKDDGDGYRIEIWVGTPPSEATPA